MITVLTHLAFIIIGLVMIETGRTFINVLVEFNRIGKLNRIVGFLLAVYGSIILLFLMFGTF